MLGLDWLKDGTGYFKAGVGRVFSFRLETHGGAIAAAILLVLIVGATGVPGETETGIVLIRVRQIPVIS